MSKSSNRSCRCVTRLDGSRGKKQVWRPKCANLRSFGSKCTVLKKLHVTLLVLISAPGTIWRPRNCDTLDPPRYAPVLLSHWSFQEKVAWRITETTARFSGSVVKFLKRSSHIVTKKVFALV